LKLKNIANQQFARIIVPERVRSTASE